MKIKKLKLRNFAKFSDFEIEFNSNVTRLVGVNGSGKTTVGLTAIWAGFKGIAESSGKGQLVGERFRFIGKNGKSTGIEITLQDGETEITLKRLITKDANKITFEAPEGYNVDEQWLTNLLNMSFLSAKHFAALNGKSQAIALGVDTEQFDQSMTQKKHQAKVIRAQIKTYGEVKKVEKAEKVSVYELIADRDKIQEFNKKQETATETKTTLVKNINEYKESIVQLKRDLEGSEKCLTMNESRLKDLVLEPLKSTADLDNKIANADKVNEQALAYDQYLSKKAEKEKVDSELKANLKDQKKIEVDKVKYIQTFDFGFKELAVDEDGHLMINEKPVRPPFFSRSEMEIIVAKLYASQKPDLKVRFIDDFESLDEANQKKLLESLLESGFQVITAEVGDEVIKKNTILLRECAVVKTQGELV